MPSLIEQHFKENKDRLRVLEEASNGSWLAINRGPLTRYANRLLRNWESAEDCVQEAYVRALTYIHSFKPGRSFDSWFFIILTRVIQQTMANNGNTPELVEADDEKLSADEYLSEVQAPEEAAALHEWATKSDSLLFRLSPRDQNIVKLFFVYGHKMSEISQLLDLNIHTVERVLFHNRSKLIRG